MTLEEYLAKTPKLTVLEALDHVWKGWCQDPKCPNHPWHGVKSKTIVHVKLPEDFRL